MNTICHVQVQQMQALVAQTKAAKQGAKQTEVQLAASAEQLANKDQEIAALRVSLFLCRVSQGFLASV